MNLSHLALGEVKLQRLQEYLSASEALGRVATVSRRRSTYGLMRSPSLQRGQRKELMWVPIIENGLDNQAFDFAAFLLVVRIA